MPVRARDPLELIPVFLGILSVALFFGLPAEINENPGPLHGWYLPAIFSSIPAACAILFGIWYVNRRGTNGVVWVGVSISIMLLILDLAFLLAFYTWKNIGF